MIENLRKENKEAIKSKRMLSDQMKAELQRQRKAIREEIEGVADILVQAREKRLAAIRENQVREKVLELVKQRKDALRAAEQKRHEELRRQEQQRALQELQLQQQQQQLQQEQLQREEDERQERLFRARAEQVRREREENLAAFVQRQHEARLQELQQQQLQREQEQRVRRAREMQRSHAQLVEHELQRQTLQAAQGGPPLPPSTSAPEAPPSRQVIAWYQRFTDNYRMRQLQDRALRLKGAVFDT